MTDHGVVWWFLVKLYVPMQIDLQTGKDDVAASPAMTTWDYSSQDQGSLHPNDQTLVPQTELYGWDWTTTHTVCYQKLRTQRWWTTESTLANFLRKPMVMGCIGVPHFYESHRIQSHAHLMASESPRQGYSSQNLPSMSSTECGSGVCFEAFQKAIAAIFSRSLQSSIHLEVCDAFQKEVLKLSDDFSSFSDIIVDFPWFSHSNLHCRGFPVAMFDYRRIFSQALQAEDGRSGGWGGSNIHWITGVIWRTLW